MRVMEKIRAFITQDSVLFVSCVAALVSCIAIAPDEVYFSYIDWHTIVLLFCLMTVVTGLRFLGVIRIMGEWVVSHMRSQAMIAGALIALTFFCSMFITNDVALITFVPFALVIMHKANMDDCMVIVVVLMTIAANLGSMLLPMGNPQNLYLFQASGFDVFEFVALMAPYTATVAVVLGVMIAFLFRKRSKGSAAVQNRKNQLTADSQDVSPDQDNHEHHHLLRDIITRRSLPVRKLFCAVVYAVLFVACLCAVADLVNVYLVGAVILVVVLLIDRKILVRVDYGLLLTFIALFIFVGNMGRIPLVHEVVSQLIGAAPVIASVALSQIISNVPAALLLSGFTDQWCALIIGTNIGGLGTLIASMASIISFKLITTAGFAKKSDYIRTFTFYNVVFLALLLVLYAALSFAGVYAS